MRYQTDWERPIYIHDDDMVENFSSTMEEYTGALDGKPFKAKVIYAYTKLIEFTTKKGKPRQSEVLHLVLTAEKGTYIEYDMWGNSRTYDQSTNTWGAWSDNSAEMQDFLFICGSQKGKEFMEHFHKPNDEREIYPHLCGVELYVVAAKTGETERNGKFYDKNEFVFFNKDGRSALEMQNKQEPLEIKDISAQLIAKHNKFVGIDSTIPQSFGGVEVESVQEIKNPDNQTTDDLPF